MQFASSRKVLLVLVVDNGSSWTSSCFVQQEKTFRVIASSKTVRASATSSMSLRRLMGRPASMSVFGLSSFQVVSDSSVGRWQAAVLL